MTYIWPCISSFVSSFFLALCHWLFLFFYAQQTVCTLKLELNQNYYGISMENDSYIHVRIHLLAYLSRAHFLLALFSLNVYSPCPGWPLTFNVLIFLLAFLYLCFNYWFCHFYVLSPYNFGKCGHGCLSPCKSYCDFLWTKTIHRLSEN